MFAKSGTERSKTEIDVTLALSGADAIDAKIFVAFGERVTDLLNDPRNFIPVRLTTGETSVVAKSTIVSITEKHQEPEDEPAFESEQDARDEAAEKTGRRAFDPYEVLRVTSSASIEEIRRAYKARMKAVHPDAIAALDLDDDLKRAASRSAQRVNYAYKMIMKDRRVEEA